ncbi:hypothetical protein HHK36_008144 [Tetracentron sinense]|uniref:RING-type E3 ubiquitin transferase n=1 Tax=Tetracentron sinense TaxID=13715 RepID=A0A834ZEY9_TETSI|nr:hypothetical protein HHK36_008144 [Tetracentron sinense]
MKNITFSFIYLLLLLPAVQYAGAQPGIDSPPSDRYGLNAKFNPSLAIIIVILVSVVFFMAFFSIYIRQCTDSRNGGTFRRAVGLSRRGVGVRGLDPAVIETFPTFVYSVVKGLKIGKGALECAVCLNEFEDHETLRLLPKCDHVFHPDCIDAWLGSHTTCPVCRANLVPQPGEPVGVLTIQIPDSDGESDVESRRSEMIVEPENQVPGVVNEEQNRDLKAPDVVKHSQVINQNRPPRSRSTRNGIFGKFPRSHSTGHSLVQPGENFERFTLRLPEDVRKQIMNGKLNRTTSAVIFPRVGSTRRGYRSGGEESSRGKSSQQLGRLDRGAKSDRWAFSMAPPFFSRTSSVRSPKINADAESSATPPSILTSVRAPFEFLGPKADGAEPSTARPPV